MHVILVAPHFPSNQRRFVRGLKNVGARVTGIGDAPASVLDAETRSMLDGYEQVPNVCDVAAMTEAGHYREADARALEAVTALQRISPEDEYNNTYAASVLGNLRQAEGRHGEAIPHFRRALAGVQKIYGADHIETAQVRIALASSLIASEVPAALGEAESLIDAVFVTLNRKPEPENETTLGCAYLERGRLHLVRGHRQAANADIGEALKRLDVPEYAPKLRQAQALARKLAAR